MIGKRSCASTCEVDISTRRHAAAPFICPALILVGMLMRDNGLAISCERPSRQLGRSRNELDFLTRSIISPPTALVNFMALLGCAFT